MTALTTPRETRREAIARWEREGYLDPECPGCQAFYAVPLMPWDVHAPQHQAVSWCQSGKRPHCTCDFCW